MHYETLPYYFEISEILRHTVPVRDIIIYVSSRNLTFILSNIHRFTVIAGCLIQSFDCDLLVLHLVVHRRNVFPSILYIYFQILDI